jgi:hypothetical protein
MSAPESPSVTIDAPFEPLHPTTFLVVFENRPPRRGFRLLRPGFRHCFCLFRDRDGWLLCDPRSDRLVLRHAPVLPAVTLARSYAALGATVVALRGPLPSAAGRRPRWLAPFTCVEVVKRLIGCERRTVFTPYALYRFLRGNVRTIFLASSAEDRVLTEVIGSYTYPATEIAAE